jgi:hypothetical protein
MNRRATVVFLSLTLIAGCATSIAQGARTASPPKSSDMSLSFDVKVTPAAGATNIHPGQRARCAGQKKSSVECTVFHYKIRNSGTKAVLWTQLGCSEFGIFPQYLTDGEWIPVYQNLECTVNVPVQTLILPGHDAEGDFNLWWGYDLKPFRTPGEYTFRLVLVANVCFASADGTNCIAEPHNEPPLTSSELTVRTQ